MKKILFIVTVPVSILLAVQLCLTFPDTRELFTRIDELESTDVIESAFHQVAQVELSLDYGVPSNDITIYFNAREVARFNQTVLTLRLDCDGVIQIKNGTDESLVVAASCNAPHCVEMINTVFPKGLSALCTLNLG